MEKKNINLVLAFFTLLVLTSLASAWIVPDTHDYIGKKALEITGTGTATSQIISQNFGDFSACMSVTDYSVFFYFTEGFNNIGKQYLASHNYQACLRAIEIADKSNPQELACAYGICGMSLEDAPSHNGFVPMLVEKTGLVNGLVHALGEQCVNQKITTKQMNIDGRNNLANNYQEHRAFLIKVFESDERASDIDVGKMMDAFVGEVVQSEKYSVGFRGFTAVPVSIHILLVLLFLLLLFVLAKLIRMKNRNVFNKISIIIVFLFLILIILIYVLYFRGTLWKTFQVASAPLCTVMPINGYETYLNQAIQNMVNFYNNGASALYQIPDPAGLNALHNADKGNNWKMTLITIILLGLIALFVWLNFKKRRK